MKVTVVQYKRDNDNEIIFDYHRDEDGKRLEGDAGKEKYLQTETIEHDFGSESEAAEFIIAWTRAQQSDDVIAHTPTGDVRGGFAIAWAQRHLDVTEQVARAEANQTHYIHVKGKKYLRVD